MKVNSSLASGFLSNLSSTSPSQSVNGSDSKKRKREDLPVQLISSEISAPSAFVGGFWGASTSSSSKDFEMQRPIAIRPTSSSGSPFSSSPTTSSLSQTSVFSSSKRNNLPLVPLFWESQADYQKRQEAYDSRKKPRAADRNISEVDLFCTESL